MLKSTRSMQRTRPRMSCHCPERKSVHSSVDTSLTFRSVAVVLLVVYASYLLFQLKTHTEMYNATGKKVEKRNAGKTEGTEAMGVGTGAVQAKGGIKSYFKTRKEHIKTRKDAVADKAKQSRISKFFKREKKDDEEEDEPQLSAIGQVALTNHLFRSPLTLLQRHQFMVSGISGFVDEYPVSPEFVGLILIPIVGNAAEHVTAITCAIKDKMDLVIIGWIAGKSGMDLDFDPFLITVLFVAVILVNALISDGASHWVLLPVGCLQYGDCIVLRSLHGIRSRFDLASSGLIVDEAY
ncbi:hypothetical protein MRB53_038923 [Persea americana]|nr:hypothetical protein MRB53_038923 [Persea americana]